MVPMTTKTVNALMQKRAGLATQLQAMEDRWADAYLESRQDFEARRRYLAVSKHLHARRRDTAAKLQAVITNVVADVLADVPRF